MFVSPCLISGGSGRENPPPVFSWLVCIVIRLFSYAARHC